MKELERKCFWNGVLSKVLIILVIANAVCLVVGIFKHQTIQAVLNAFACLMCGYSAFQVSSYFKFLQEAKKKPHGKHYYSASQEISRIKLSFNTFLPMYLANKGPWTSTETKVQHYVEMQEFGNYCCGIEEHITIVYFDFPEYLKYRKWVKQRMKLEAEAKEKKAEAEFTENELKLNLQFLDTVSKDVEKMKASAEADMQQAMDELKKAAQQK